MAKKRTNLQPWLDYFKMLQRYEQEGFLQMNPQEHETYVTRAALLTLSNINPEDIQSATILSQPPTIIADTLSRLRAYAAYRWAPVVGQQHPVDINDPNAEIPVIPIEELTAYFSQPFAIHIVKEDYPHDLLLTLLLQQKRTWYGRCKETIEVIDYTEK